MEWCGAVATLTLLSTLADPKVFYSSQCAIDYIFYILNDNNILSTPL